MTLLATEPLCSWPDEHDIPCGKPATKRLVIWEVVKGSRRRELDYCWRHMPGSRESRLRADGYMVVTLP